MAFETPTLNDFVRISENGLSTAFYGESSVLRKSVLKVLARVFCRCCFSGGSSAQENVEECVSHDV